MPAYFQQHNKNALLHLFALFLMPLDLWAQTVEKPTLSATQRLVVDLPEIVITASTVTNRKPWAQSPSGVGEVTVIDAKEIASKPAARIEEVLQNAGLATGDAGSNFGLTPSIGLRGFSVNSQTGTPFLVPSNILLNGHADIANGFTRDMSTVERIEVMGGFDSTIVGAGSPSGIVQYQTKRPQGKDAARLDSTFASDGLKRITLDIEKSLEVLQVRFVAASQSGQKTIEGQGTDRDNVFLSSRLNTPIGQFRLDLEHQNNRAPYVFGTFYANGKFWYDLPYASPQNQSSRQASRSAIYYDHRVSESTQIKAWLQNSYVKQESTLVGFWGVKDANTLDGYTTVR
jgi:outer membrane cobalamin receptor